MCLDSLEPQRSVLPVLPGVFRLVQHALVIAAYRLHERAHIAIFRDNRLHHLPFSQEPVADLDELNLWMAETECTHFAQFMAASC